MDPYPPPPPPSLFPHSTTFPNTSISNHPNSTNSSPRSRPDTTWDDPLPPIPGAKLRLMCSYGGHIIPRPHDKSLCYVGGDTRIVVVDRHSTLAELHSRLSLTLLNGRHFTLKYQLPSEDLDSQISLANDEDFENMIEEYDRTSSSSPFKPSRLRLFLFPSKPVTAASMGSLLDDAKSETWFVDALNGAGLLHRGLSESAAIDTLLELDHGMINNDSCTDLVAQNESNHKQVVAKSNDHEVVMDSPPMVETSSSFGSSSSSPSMVNLPPIKVRGEDYLMVGLDEQFSRVSIAPSLASVTSPPVPCLGVAATAKSGGRYGGGENGAIYEDEKLDKSDHEFTVAPTGLMRKPPLPLQPVQRKLVDIHNLPSPDSNHAGAYNLPSPDSVASDSSNGSAVSLSKHAIHQDATQFVNRENRISPPPALTSDPNISSSNINIQYPRSSSQQVSAGQQLIVDSVNQQQFMIPSTHYIHHPGPGLPISSYYHPIYLHPQTQQTDSISYDPTIVSSARPLTSPPLPPVYPTKPAEMAANMHQMGSVVVRVPPPHQFQHHYIGLSQIPPPPQSNAAAAASVSTSNYGYEYSHHHMQDHQGYFAHQLPASAPLPPPQYQTMTPAAAVMFSHASTQLLPDNAA